MGTQIRRSLEWLLGLGVGVALVWLGDRVGWRVFWLALQTGLLLSLPMVAIAAALTGMVRRSIRAVFWVAGGTAIGAMVLAIPGFLAARALLELYTVAQQDLKLIEVMQFMAGEQGVGLWGWVVITGAIAGGAIGWVAEEAQMQSQIQEQLQMQAQQGSSDSKNKLPLP